jgi:hypothetical protein
MANTTPPRAVTEHLQLFGKTLCQLLHRALRRICMGRLKVKVTFVILGMSAKNSTHGKSME